MTLRPYARRMSNVADVLAAALAALCFMHGAASLAAEPEGAAATQDAAAAGSGFELQFTFKNDLLANVSGGSDRGVAWLGHAEAMLSLDLEKLLGWNAATAYVHYHSDLGSKFNEHYVGSYSGVDNIEVATNTAQFYQAWIQKNFLEDRLSILGGLYAIDADFYLTDTSAELIAPPYGMSTELSQTGRNGPPIFAIGALGVRVKYTTPGNEFYAIGALTDGVPGDPDDPRGTHVKLEDGDGSLLIMEFGYTPQAAPPAAGQKAAEIFNKTAIGFWRYTSHFDDVDASVSRRQRSQGVYLLAERSLYLEPLQPAQGLAGFVRLGHASERTNQVDWTASLGLRYHGLLAGRDDDIAALAVSISHASDRYRRANGGEAAEIAWELTYRAQVLPWLAIQPDLQYLVNPGMDATLKNACIIGVRAEMSF